MARNLEDTGKHLIQILRQGGRTATGMEDILLDGRDDILTTTIKAMKTSATQSQVIALVHKETGELTQIASAYLLAQGLSAAEFQATGSQNYLAVLGATDAKLFSVSETFIKKVFNDPMVGQNITVNNMLVGTMAGMDKHIVNVTRQALSSGQSILGIAKLIESATGGLDDAVLRRQAQALARTAISKVANATRFAAYEAESDVKGYLYTATLDHRTTIDICAPLDGTFYSKSVTPRIPPLHVNCRSTLIPVLKGETLADVKDQLKRPAVEIKSVAELEKRGLHTRTGRVRKPSRSDRSPLKGVVKPKYVTYEQWLGSQPVAYQKEILGTKAFSSFQDTGRLSTALSAAS